MLQLKLPWCLRHQGICNSSVDPYLYICRIYTKGFVKHIGHVSFNSLCPRGIIYQINGQHWSMQWPIAWWHQAITSTNVDFPSVIYPMTHCNEALRQFSFTNMHSKILSAKYRHFCPGPWRWPVLPRWHEKHGTNGTHRRTKKFSTCLFHVLFVFLGGWEIMGDTFFIRSRLELFVHGVS